MSVKFMERRMPRAVTYLHVDTRLDAGCGLTKCMEKLEEIKRNYKYRKDEVFKRLKVTTFVQMILQVGTAPEMNKSESDGGSQGGKDCPTLMDLKCQAAPTSRSPRLSDSQAVNGNETFNLARSTLLSVIKGVGELNVTREKERALNESLTSSEPVEAPYPNCPYLLLDIREREQYDCCHIISAHSFPSACLSRTMNPYTKEVLQYKNATGKIIIVYDDDERIASQAATAMCQRGFENLFMLSGGLKIVAQKFPEGMTTGSIPSSCLSTKYSRLKKKKRPVRRQPLQAAEERWRFTSDELAKIQQQLDAILINSDSFSKSPVH